MDTHAPKSSPIFFPGSRNTEKMKKKSSSLLFNLYLSIATMLPFHPPPTGILVLKKRKWHLPSFPNISQPLKRPLGRLKSHIKLNRKSMIRSHFLCCPPAEKWGEAEMHLSNSHLYTFSSTVWVLWWNYIKIELNLKTNIANRLWLNVVKCKLEWKKLNYCLI